MPLPDLPYPCHASRSAAPHPTVHASRHRAPRQWLGSGMPLGWIGSTTAFGAVGFTGQERREARTVSQSRTRAISDLAVRWFRPPELWSPTKKPPSVGCGPAHVLRIGGAALAGIKHRASPARGCRSGRAPRATRMVRERGALRSRDRVDRKVSESSRRSEALGLDKPRSSRSASAQNS